MANKYVQLNDGDSVEIDKEDGRMYFSCCDCGLVHKFAFAIEDSGNIGFALERDNRRTGQRRRYHSFDKK